MKKRFIAMLVIAAVFVSFTACGNNSNGVNGDSIAETTTEEDIYASGKVVPLEVMTGSQTHHSSCGENEMYKVQTAYASVLLSDKCAKAFPMLQNALEIETASGKSNSETEHKDLFEYFCECAESGDSLWYDHAGNVADVFVRRADSVVTSLLYYDFSYSGGKSPMLYHVGRNFDSKTGKTLMIEDVVTDLSTLTELVKEQYEKNYQKDYSDYSNISDMDFSDIFNWSFREPLDVTWTIDYNGLSVYFNTRDIFSYMLIDSQIVTISFAENPTLFNEKYTQVPETYAVELNRYLPYRFDLNGDGTLDEICTGFYYGDNEDWFEGIYSDAHFDEIDHASKYNVTVNGKTLSLTPDAYEADFTFVHGKDGNYIYVEKLYDDDRRTTDIISIADGEAQKIGSNNNYMKHYYGKDEIDYRTVLTNPESFETK